MIPYFPKLISNKAITYYFITLVAVSALFFNRMLPFIWVLFGVVEVCAFFYFSNSLTKKWLPMRSKSFVKKLFWIALLIRLIYMVFVYFFYDAMTGQPFMFHSADEQVYYEGSMMWRDHGFKVFREAMKGYSIDDTGEIYFTALLYLVVGPYVLTARIAHCFLSALSCVLIYRIARRHFGESTARMSAIFCMLMPNLIYYCGIHLKEADMVFVTVLFVDSVDVVLNEHNFDWKSIVLALASAFLLFTFRTVLGAVGLISIGVAGVLGRGKLGSWWKRILLVVMVGGALATTTIGMKIINEVESAWGRKDTNQEEGMAARAQQEGGNTFAKYASAAVFAPLIFTIPFPTMVHIDIQENQMMLHGGNYVKNVTSGFTILALFLLLFSGDWRKHALPIAMMCGYLIVIAFSNFAQSERFHQPALPLELMFAAYGISQLQKKQLPWINYWMMFIFVANVGWAWFKLAGRGMT